MFWIFKEWGLQLTGMNKEVGLSIYIATHYTTYCTVHRKEHTETPIPLSYPSAYTRSPGLDSVGGSSGSILVSLEDTLYTQ